MDKILDWLRNNKILVYDIFDGGNVKRCHSENERIEDTLQDFERDYDTLPDGKYRIKGMTKKSADRAAVNLDFTIGFGHGKTSNSMDIEALKKEYYERGLKDAKIDMLTEEVRTLRTKLDKFIQVVSDRFDELDGDNDKDVFAKVTDVATKLNDAKTVLQDFKL